MMYHYPSLLQDFEFGTFVVFVETLIVVPVVWLARKLAFR